VLELRFPPGVAESLDGQLTEWVSGGLAERVELLPDRVLVYTHDGDAAVAEVHSRGLQPTTTLVRRSSLEDVFLRLTGRTLVDS
jgi:lipooligosaccharide transport system ATP-binding protein